MREAIVRGYASKAGFAAVPGAYGGAGVSICFRHKRGAKRQSNPLAVIFKLWIASLRSQ